MIKVSITIFVLISLTGILTGLSVPATDDPRQFLGNSFVTNINSLPLAAECPKTPWSADYCAWRYGGISARFAAQDTRWRSYAASVGAYSQPSDYNTYHSTASFSTRVSNIYSTAEKYDVLVGDTSFTMTRASKQFGLKFRNAQGDVDSWMGMCDGWSMASWRFDEPLHSIRTVAADGKTAITWWVDDIKNLASLFWRGATYNNRMVGTRSGPLNPASMFLIFANNVGLKRQNMNIEPIADNEIWNYPAKNYRASIQSKIALATARSSGNAILRQAAANAPAGTANLVAVNMSVSYVQETTAAVNPAPRKIGSSVYSFVLHCSAAGDILGGVYTSSSKASYVWGSATDVSGPFDGQVSAWTGSAAQLAAMTAVAQKSSASMMPLKNIILRLVALARS
jgi:hypothetical protein